jgi:hypothetical protein
VQVTDEREDKASQCTLPDAEAHVFGELLLPRRVAGSGAAAYAASAAYARLVAQRLVLELGGYALALPYQLSCRPVPWNVF